MAQAADAATGVRRVSAMPAGDLSWLLSQASYALVTELTAALAARESRLVPTRPGHGDDQRFHPDGSWPRRLASTDDDGRDARRARGWRPSGAPPTASDRRVRVVSVTQAGKRKVTQARRGHPPDPDRCAGRAARSRAGGSARALGTWWAIACRGPCSVSPRCAGAPLGRRDQAPKVRSRSSRTG